MDRLEGIASTLSQVTVYDLKSMYNQARNMVLNVSEMEAKVREATNDEPWGASSTLMQEIAQGTFNFQHFNEIMPCIYSRFMEKEARQWREIYKALQLLEYLIKNGSERVVDDARSHISTIKMLRSFHYIDDKGKDQGINVRNRAKEIVELLSDVEKIRLERRKAKSNRTKYIGTGNDAMSFSSGGSRYGGFGSDSLGGGSSSYSAGGSGGSGSYGGGGGGYDRDFGGYSGGSGGFRDETSKRGGGFEEYDAGDDEAPVQRSNSLSQRTGNGAATLPRRSGTQPAPEPPAKEKEPEKIVDLLGFGDEEYSVAAPSSAPMSTAPAPASSALLDDDFGDFAAAPPSAGLAKPSLMDMLNSNPAPTNPTSPPPYATAAPRMSMSAQPSTIYTNTGFSMISPTSTGTRPSVSMSSPPIAPTQNTMFSGGQPMTPASPPPRSSFASPVLAGTRTGTPASTTSKSSGAGAFDDLWSMSLGSTTSSRTGTPSNSGASGKKSIKDLEKEKAQAGIWGHSNRGSMAGSMGGFNSFGGSSGTTNAAPPPSSSNAGGVDDLLL